MKQHALMAALALGALRPRSRARQHRRCSVDDRPRPWRFVDGSAGNGCSRACGRTGTRSPSCRTPRSHWTGDVDAARRVIAASSGPVILVGHSYGGVVITKPATIRKSWGSSTSPPRPRQRGNRSPS